jgi:hypothetical protein
MEQKPRNASARAARAGDGEKMAARSVDAASSIETVSTHGLSKCRASPGEHLDSLGRAVD